MYRGLDLGFDGLGYQEFRQVRFWDLGYEGFKVRVI